jgi:hypothetical protein
MLVCRPHQRKLKDGIQRKYRVTFDVDGRAHEQTLERPETETFGLTASIGRALRQVSLFQGPFLPAYAIRRYRFEETSITDDPDEMLVRHYGEQALVEKLRRLFG